jgi:uncharacterized membrane protein
VRAPARFATYAALGWLSELVWLRVVERPRPNRRRWPGAWMLPIYGLSQPLYEPVHDALRERPVAERAAAYCLGFFAVEYASGRLLRATVGEAPWDYSHASLNLHGLIRASYVPVWAAAGLALEPLHDALV